LIGELGCSDRIFDHVGRSTADHERSKDEPSNGMHGRPVRNRYAASNVAKFVSIAQRL
jgi:hypothetical protein